MFFFFTAVSSVMLGVLFLRFLNLPPTVASHAAATLSALCLQAAICLMVGTYSLRNANAALTLFQIALVLYFLFWSIRIPNFFPTLPRDPVSISSLCAIAIALLAACVSALAPVTSWDAGVAHLALASEYVNADRIMLLQGNNYSAYPQLMHVLFGLAFADGGEPRADTDWPDFQWAEHSSVLIVWFLGVLTSAIAYGLGSRLQSRTIGYIAAAIVVTSPIFAEQASTPSLDLAFTATVLGALYAIAAWHDDQRAAWLVIAGALAGSGCGIRHTAYLVDVLLLVGVVIAARGTRLRDTVLFAGTMFVSAAPWLIRTALVVGNPVYPFFASHFSGPTVPDVDVAAIGTHSSLQGKGLAQLLTFPWSLTMNPAHYGGWSTSPGALWLVLGVLGVLVGGRRAQVLGLFSGTGMVALFFFQRFARYAFPFLAPMMVVAALPFEKLPKLRWLIVPVLLLSYSIGLAPALAGAALKLPVVIGHESREDYLARHVERYPAMAWAAKNIHMHSIILSVDPRGYYFDHPTYTNFEALKLIAPLGIEAQRGWLRNHRIGYVFYADAYAHDSPAFRETGVLDMLNAWRADTEHFVLMKDFELPNPRDGGNERVEIYEFRP